VAAGTGRGWLTGASGLRPTWTVAPVPPPAGEHRVTSRAFDTDGNLQPPPDDPYLSSRRTYWENNGQITRRVRI
jgi:hypothetical protein